jgi:hypothetical protein
MWRTPQGERILRGAEWDLFREGLAALCDQVEDSFDDPERCCTEIDVFDRLIPAQKLAMIAAVGTALSEQATPCPELTAVAEGTIAAVFSVIRTWIDIEINDQTEGNADLQEPQFRDLLLATVLEFDPGAEVPERNCADPEAWGLILDSVTGRVLWDEDFLEEDWFVDADPHATAPLKRELGIDEDYFTALAPDPAEEELRSIRVRLRALCHGG